MKGGFMRKLVFLYFCALLLAPMVSSAQAPGAKERVVGEVPPIVLSGLQAYRDSGPDAALRAWIKGSSLEGTKDALSQANILRQVQDYYGTYRAFEVVSTEDISPKTRAIYLVLDFDRGPLFVKFVVYRSDQGWITAYFNSNTKEELVFPQCQ